MSDDARDVDLTKTVPDDEVGQPDTFLGDAVQFDATETVEARANYATYAVALAKTAEADRDGDAADPADEVEAGQVEAGELEAGHFDSDEVGAGHFDSDETFESDDTVYSGLEEPAGVVAVPEVEEVADSEEKAETPTRNLRRDLWQRQITVKPLPVVLVLLLLITGGVATWLYFQYYRPDQQTSQSVARSAISAASDGTVALLSYSPDSLDKDFASARSHLSGDFLSYYDQFTQQIVAPAAKQKSLKTTARVMRAAVQELRPTSAVVLVFVDQSTTSKDNPEPSMAASSVLVNLALVDGKWLITKFTPV